MAGLVECEIEPSRVCLQDVRRDLDVIPLGFGLYATAM